MTKNLLKVSKNKILGGNITLFQPDKGFRVSIDSILLSSSVKKYTNCMEFGTGSGVILIYLSKKFPDATIIGIEKRRQLRKGRQTPPSTREPQVIQKGTLAQVRCT